MSRAVRPSVNEIGADGGARDGRANVLSLVTWMASSSGKNISGGGTTFLAEQEPQISPKDLSNDVVWAARYRNTTPIKQLQVNYLKSFFFAPCC